MSKRKCRVKYQVATYSGEVTVYVDEDDCNDVAERAARRVVERRMGGSLPFGYHSFTVVSSEFLAEENHEL
jgi:hypothetical protein